MSGVRIGVDLCRIDPAALGPADHALLDTLAVAPASWPDDVALVLFGSRALRAARPDLFGAVESHVVPFPPGVAALRVGVEATWLRGAARRAGVDLLHHAGGTRPLPADVPAVVSLHDLAPFEGGPAVGRAQAAYRRRVVPGALAEAAAVLVPSEHVRARLTALLDVDEAKVQVVPWPLPPHAEPARIDMVRARHGIVGRIVLVPADADPADQVVAVRAMRHLAGRHKETTLVLLGGDGILDRAVAQEVRSLGLEDRVTALPRLGEPARAALVEEAVVVVDLAVRHSFASPTLEAMACGVPVVAIDAGAAPELVEGAGAVVARGDDAQLAVEVHRVLDDPEWREQRAQAGLDRARAHTPAEVAQRLLAAYRRAMAGL